MSKAKTARRNLSINRLTGLFLNLQEKQTARSMLQSICTGIVSAGLLAMIPFYPYAVLFLLVLGIGALALRYPRIALSIAIFLSVPALAYHSVGAWLIYLALCLTAILAIENHWLSGVLTLSAIELWVIGLPWLSPLPIILAGLTISSYSGTIAGLVSALFAFFFTYGQVTLEKPPLSNFAVSSIYDVFAQPGFAENLVSFCNRIVYSLNSIAPYVEVAFWGVGGYVAGKSIQWWRDVGTRRYKNLYPTSLAALSSSAVFISGWIFVMQFSPLYTGFMLLSPVLLLVSFSAGLGIGFLKLQNKLTRIQSSVGKVISDLTSLLHLIQEQDHTKTRLNLHEREQEVIRLTSKLDEALELCHAWRFDEASKSVENSEKAAENARESLSEGLKRSSSLEKTLRETENTLRVLERNIERAKNLYPGLETSKLEEEASSILSNLRKKEDPDQHANLTALSEEATMIKNRCDSLALELDQEIQVWENWPQWKSQVKKRLDKNSKATTSNLEGIDPSWRRYALVRYWEESQHEGLLLEDNTLVKTRGRQDCPKCGTPSPIGSVYCYLCGSKLGETDRTLVTYKLNTPESKMKQIQSSPLASEIDETLFNYIVQHGGTISMREAVRDLNITEGDLKASIERLMKANRLETKAEKTRN